MRQLGYYLGSLALIFGFVLSGCAVPQKPAAAPEKPAAASPVPAAPQVQLTREQQLVEGAKKEGEVVVWGSLSEWDELVRLFQGRYPFLKVKIWDGRDTDIMAKVVEEAKIGRHSVDILIGSTTVPILYNQRLLAEYDFPNAAGWPGQPKHKYYIGFTGSGRVVAYNTDLVAPTEVPKSWDDVKSTKWAGKTLVSVSGYDIPLLWAYLWRENDKLNWDRSFAFWGEVIRNTRPTVSSGYSAPMQLLAAGAFALFPHVSSPSTMRMMVLGAPLGMAPLPVPVSGSGLALVKDAPHPNGGKLFIDWLTTPEGLLALSDPRMAPVLHPDLQRKARANSLFSSLGMTMDVAPVELLADEANLKKSSDFWLKTLGAKQ